MPNRKRVNCLNQPAVNTWKWWRTKMRYFLTLYILAIVAVVGVAGFRGSISRKPPIEVFPDMDRQWKLRPQEPNRFFANQRSSQPFVEGTIARGTPYQDIPVNTGRLT